MPESIIFLSSSHFNAGIAEDNTYDIVTGPIANDDMAVLFRQYENETISFRTLIDGMTFRGPMN